MEEKKVTRVTLEPSPKTFVCSSSSGNYEESGPGVPLAAFRPLALLLRIRVTQIVAGIVCVLLGTVACLEPSTRGSLSLGILVGTIAVLSATLSIHAFRIPLNYSATSLLSNQQPLPRIVLTLFCMFSALTLIGFCGLFLTSREKNDLGLAILEASGSFIILICEAAVWYIGWSNRPY